MDPRDKTLIFLGEAIEAVLNDIVREAVRDEMRGVRAKSDRGDTRSGIPDATKTYLTVKQAAELSRLGPSTIRLYIRKRQLKAHQVGRRVIIQRADLESFLEAHPIEVLPE